MLVHVYSGYQYKNVHVLKALLFFSFLRSKTCKALEMMRPQPPMSSFSLMLWQMFWLLHGKHKLKLQTTFYESIQAFWKTPDFNHSNYWLFERIPAVPGTSINRGLTVQSSTTPDPGYQCESDVTIRHHKWEPRDQPFPSRWPQGINKQMCMKA